MLLNGLRALLFDVFGKVVDWRTGIARETNLFLRRHGAGSVDPFAFADAWRAGYQPAMEEVRSGRRPFPRLDVLHQENLEIGPAEIWSRSSHRVRFGTARVKPCVASPRPVAGRA
jgi:hypothetical protein